MVALATFQELDRHVSLVATILESADTEHFQYPRMFCWVVLIQRKLIIQETMLRFS